jgi:L-lactate dehydrogenase complex protein LldG
MENSRDSILSDIRASLGRRDSPLVSHQISPRPAIVPPRLPGTPAQEINQLLQEISALGGNARRIMPDEMGDALPKLVGAQSVQRAVLWQTELLARLGVAAKLQALGVEIIPSNADKHVMATADLGVTESDFLLPETGTLGLLSSPDKPRSVSLLPRVHLAIAHPRALRADLHQVLVEAKSKDYLVLITGPSRTSDIELVVTIGVHGPQVLYLWVVEDDTA